MHQIFWQIILGKKVGVKKIMDREWSVVKTGLPEEVYSSE